MTDADNTGNAAIAAALHALAMTRHGTTKVHHPFPMNDPFNLDTQSGSTAYITISAPLDEIWDGEVNTFPFIHCSTLRSIRTGQMEFDRRRRNHYRRW